MSLIASALTIWGTIADTAGIAAFVESRLKRDGQSVSAVFEGCFRRAINRHRPRLAKLTETKDPTTVTIDDARLKEAISHIVSELDAKNIKGESELISYLATPLIDAVILPGHTLATADIKSQIESITTDALLDFFHKLPSYPRAVAESEISHIARSDEDHREQKESLARIEEALSKLAHAQKDIQSRSAYLDPAVIQQESTRPENRNPFRIVKAEDFNHDYDRLASLFKEPLKYDDLRGPDNLIIAGGRGCGKSMLLRSLSAITAVQLRRLNMKQDGATLSSSSSWKDTQLDYFGVYIKLARGYFYEWHSDCKLTLDAATHLFQHVFNMLLLRALLEGLVEARRARVLAIDEPNEQMIVRNICDFAGFELISPTFAGLSAFARKQERQVADYIGNLRLGTELKAYTGAHTAIHDFIDNACKAVVDSIPELRGSRIFFLLDEYENLDEFQQRVVNTLAKLRPTSLSLKIAARALGVKSVVDLQNEPIQRPRDYHVVELDYDPTEGVYRQFLLDIAAKRLDAEGYKIRDLKQLLPEAPRFHPSNESEVLAALDTLLKASGKRFADLDRSAQRECLHQWSVALVFRLSSNTRQPFTYAGFDSLADLSSGIISTFLEFCKLAFYLAQADGVDVRSGTPIPWRIQNEAIYTASQAYFDYIERNVPDKGAAISRILLDLGDIFREKLHCHTSEPEGARLIIKDPAALEREQFKRLACILDDAVRWSVLHAVGQASAYFPKHKTDVRSNDYLLNRVLAPILRISPRPRWRSRFTTAELAALADPDTRTQTRNDLRMKLKGNGGEGQAEPDDHLWEREQDHE